MSKHKQASEPQATVLGTPNQSTPNLGTPSLSLIDSGPSDPIWDMLALVMGLLTVMFIAFRFAEPVGDGDLFWQMAYGKYFLANHTLIPDHTIYSWTTSANTEIYCSWVAEIFFYCLHSLGGLPLIFAFRYVVVAGVTLLAWSYARQVGWHRRTEFLLLLATLLLSSYVGTIIKPELFSFGCMSGMAYLFFRFRLAVFRNESYMKYLIAIPLLHILWLNSHGVHLFGLVAFGCYGVGEIGNQLIAAATGKRGLALPIPIFKRLFACFVVTCLCETCSPYGWRFPFQLFSDGVALISNLLGVDIGHFVGLHLPLLDKGSKAGYGSIAAHMTIWQTPAFHFQQYLYLMGVIWAILIVARAINPAPDGARVDCVYIILNLVFALIYQWYLRTTFYWPPFFFYSTMFMLETQRYTVRRNKEPYLFAQWVGTSALALGIGGFFLLRGTYEAIYQPYASSWCGFGITYWNPVLEAEFVAKYHPDIDKVYNDYDGGGYLIWRLFPKVKVMIDPRSFPYHSWYADYIAFERGQWPIQDDLPLVVPVDKQRDYLTFVHQHLPEMFVDRWPEQADVAIISLKNNQLWRTFLTSKDWASAWVGQSSVVFCRRGHVYPPDAKEFEKDRFETVENSQKCMQIYQYMIEAQDYNHAFEILDVMKRKFHSDQDILLTQNLEAYLQALMGLQNKDLPKAIEQMEKCRHFGLFYNNQLLYQLYQVEVQGLIKEGQTTTSPAVRDIMIKMQKTAAGADPNLQ